MKQINHQLIPLVPNIFQDIRSPQVNSSHHLRYDKECQGQSGSYLEEKYPKVTLRHFATMTSGYDALNPNNKGYGNDPDDGSRTPLVPTTPAFPLGKKYSYFDDAMRTNGYILTMIAKTDLGSYFRQHIAKPIGMKDSNWEWVEIPIHDLSNPDGADVRDGAGGINITARELARFGHLFLNRGRWNGNQIISSHGEMADTLHSKCSAYGRPGSSPGGSIDRKLFLRVFKLFNSSAFLTRSYFVS